MSISLKNHEDRISALEKQTQTPKAVFVTPDYSKAVDLPRNATNYIPPSNGFMIFDLFTNFTGGSNTIFVKVNGKHFMNGSDNANDVEGNINCCLPVTTKDKISWNNVPGWNNGHGVTFIPYRLTILYYNIVRFLSRLLVGDSYGFTY